MEDRDMVTVEGKINNGARSTQVWRTRFAIIGLCLGLSMLATVPFFFMGEPSEGETRWTVRVPETLDLAYHVNEAEQFYEALKSGSAYPIWLAGANKGYGAPVTAYYPPGTYYLLSGFYSLVKNWTWAILGAYLIMMIASAAAMYFYARQHISRAGATFAMVAYIVLPFHLYEQYARGTFGELMTYIWMPLLLLFTDRLIRRGIESRRTTASAETPEILASDNPATPERKPAGVMLGIAGMALCYGAALWSHVPSIHPFSIALGIYILILGLARRDWKGVLFCGVAVALGLGLAAAYWYPALVGKDLISSGFIDPNVYHSSYVFSPNFYSDSLIWVFDLLAIVSCTIILLVVLRRDSAPLRNQIAFWLAIGCFATFMTTSASYQIGRRIPMISIGHRPFRMLMIMTLITALLMGACGHVASMAKFEARKLRYLFLGIATALLVITVAFTIVRVVAPTYSVPPEDIANIAPRTPFDPDPDDLNLVIPRTVPVLPNYDDLDRLPLSEPVKLAADHGEVTINKWEPEHRELSVELKDSDRLTIRTFNFPGWAATVDGQRTDIRTGTELGEMLLDLEAGSHAIILDFMETPVQWRGKLLNLAALIAVLGIVGVASALKMWDRRDALT
jgi:hypothetical protein